MYGYIYLLQSSDYIDTNVYKIGRTIENSDDVRYWKRLKAYPRGSVVFFVWFVKHEKVNEAESVIISSLNKKYKLVKGKEWFEGDLIDIYNDVCKTINAHYIVKEIKSPVIHIKTPSHTNAREKFVDTEDAKTIPKVQNTTNDGLIRYVRCGYTTEQKGNLIRHLKRILPCTATLRDIPISEYIDELTKKEYNSTAAQCKYCKKKFNHASNMYTHLKTCKAHIASLSPKESLEDIINKKVDEALEKRLSTHVINNNTQSNNNAINIENTTEPLRNFGFENMEALPHDFIRSRFVLLDFKGLFEVLHCTPEYPENHNVRIKSTKRQLLEMFTDNKWTITTFKNGLDNIVVRISEIFNQFRIKHKKEVLEDMSEDDLDDLVKQLDAITELSNKSKDIKKEILLILENNRLLLA
jgi:hypothetical protein